MPKVRFKETRTVKAANGPTFEKGKVYDLPPDSAEHWVKRGVGEVIDAPEPPKPVEVHEAHRPAHVARPGGKDKE